MSRSGVVSGDAGAADFVLPVLASAEVRTADPDEYSRNSPSHYADAVAWLAVEAARRALAAAPEVLDARERTAVLAVSEHCTLATMHGIARRMRKGQLSPMQFSGANPGLLAGAVCMEWRFKGPSLVLTMPPALGADTALRVARGWLRDGQADFVLVTSHRLRDAEHIAECRVLGRPR